MTFADQKKNQVLAGGIVEEKGREGKGVDHLTFFLLAFECTPDTVGPETS